MKRIMLIHLNIQSNSLNSVENWQNANYSTFYFTTLLLLRSVITLRYNCG